MTNEGDGGSKRDLLDVISRRAHAQVLQPQDLVAIIAENVFVHCRASV